MVERGIIKEEEQELYQFGIRNCMILLLNVVTALVIGLLTEQLAVVAEFTLSFMVLRSYTGGYHSDSRIFCYLGSNLVLLVPVYTQAVFYKTSLARLLHESHPGGCAAPGFYRHVEQAVHQSGNDIRAAVKRADRTCGSKAGQ